MKWLVAFSISIGLLAACYVVSALIYFDLTWILIGVTSLWAGIDSRKLELHRYRVGINCRPAALFCCCYLLWIFAFPWYLWAHFRIKAGEAELKDETDGNAGPIKRFFRQFSKRMERFAEWGLIGLVALKLAFVAVCIEESWRGPQVWDNYRHELEAKGESFDWDALTPPPVPASQNIFGVPEMAEWFIKPSGKIIMTDDLSKRMAGTNAGSAVVIASLAILPPTAGVAGTEDADAMYRYSSPGTALFPATDLPVYTNQPVKPDPADIPIIEMWEVPLTTVIENLARQADINYLMDPKIGYNLPDENGHIKPEPVVTVRWQNISARDALLALLNQYRLQLVENTNLGMARITMKDETAPPAFMTADVRNQLGKLFEQAVGPTLPSSQGLTLLARPAGQIKPVRLVLYSEKKPGGKELPDLFGAFFADPPGSANIPGLQINATGTNSYQVSVSRADTATNYLAWSDRFAPDFEVIHEALKRPYSRMDGDYSCPPTIPIPNFKNVRVVAQTLAERAQCYLLLGQPDKALRELTLLNDSRRLLEGAPTGKPMPLVSAMINVAVLGLYTDTIADGFRMHAWQEPQLSALQKQLAQINLAPFMNEAMHDEQVLGWRIMQTNVISQFEVKRLPNATLWQKIKNLRPPNIMCGFFYLNVYNMVSLEQLAVDGIDPATKTVRLDKMAEFQTAVGALGGQHEWIFKPYHLFAAIMVPNYYRAITTFAFNQTKADEAQIACALERYCFTRGSYPETLNELVPQFIDTLPHDIMGGQALKYRRTNEGRFLLYSVGANGLDDGGQATDARHDIGDWCWQ